MLVDQLRALVAYSEAKRTGKDDQKFGEGEPDGIIATESANSATVGGGFIPTLVLGIPGTPPDAIVLGALLVQGVRTGPAMFSQSGIYSIYIYIWLNYCNHINVTCWFINWQICI